MRWALDAEWAAATGETTHMHPVVSPTESDGGASIPIAGKGGMDYYRLRIVV